jgi:tetratricopeptide (TPR) repeat protein
MTTGQYGAALREIGKAETLDPESTAIPADKAMILFHAGKLKEAERLLMQLESDQPEFSAPHRYLAPIRYAEGNDAAYLGELRRTALIRGDRDGESVVDAGTRGQCCGRCTTVSAYCTARAGNPPMRSRQPVRKWAT